MYVDLWDRAGTGTTLIAITQGKALQARLKTAAGDRKTDVDLMNSELAHVATPPA
ncbi:segregation/condensation protein A, partial [Xanthomonas perforans]